MEPPFARPRKRVQPMEVLDALVLRVVLSRGLDRLSSLLADQGRQYQNHPASRAGCHAHPASPRLPHRDRPPFDISHPASLALPPALARWLVVLLAGSSRPRRRPSLRRLG